MARPTPVRLAGTKRPELATEVMCTDAGLHADQARRNIGESCFNLATRPLLTQRDCTGFIKTNDMERVLTDIDADYGNRSAEISETWRAPRLWRPFASFYRWRGRSTAGPSH
jgi:hypothetical protein